MIFFAFLGVPIYKSQNILRFEPYHDLFFDFSQSFYDTSSYGSAFKKVISNDGFNLNWNHGALSQYKKRVKIITNFLYHKKVSYWFLRPFETSSIQDFKDLWFLRLETCILVCLIFERVLYFRASYDRENMVHG